MNRLVIIGAGGHGRVVADLAVHNGYTDICFVDDHATGACMGFPIIGGTAGLAALNDGRTDFVIGIGSNGTRRAIAEKYDVNWVTLIHPAACIGIHVTVGCGTVVMAGAVVNACACIGRHCIINSRAVVEHDNQIADYVHISPGVSLGGTVSVGTLTHIGIGAAVRNNIHICGGSTIGAGAAVVEHIDRPGTYIGVPAKEMV